VQDFLKALEQISDNSGISPDIINALRRDPIKRCRDLVKELRRTSQRRDGFRKSIASDVAAGKVTCPKLELIRDMVVRWSSTYYMVERCTLIYKVSPLISPHAASLT
jgi:hypothetical protein